MLVQYKKSITEAQRKSWRGLRYKKNWPTCANFFLGFCTYGQTHQVNVKLFKVIKLALTKRTVHYIFIEMGTAFSERYVLRLERRLSVQC